MKKTLLVILAIVMASTMVMGSVSTVSAAMRSMGAQVTGTIVKDRTGGYSIKYSYSVEWGRSNSISVRSV